MQPNWISFYPEPATKPCCFLRSRRAFRCAIISGILLGSAPTVLARQKANCSHIGAAVSGVQPGSLDDVNAVGCRKLGGRGVGNWYSAQSERDWGNETAVQVLHSARTLGDTAVDEYLNRLAQKLVENSDAQYPFHVYVLKAAESNAFALPGGYLFLDSGLILAARNEAQLAAVMAHEIAHIAAHHAAREQTNRIAGRLVAVPAFFAYPPKLEEQADWLGAQYLYRAGYDPEQMIAFLKSQEKDGQGLVSRTHPAVSGRIAYLERKIKAGLPKREDPAIDTPAFHAMQARLQTLLPGENSGKR